jgi:hypothetical protein
MKNLSDSIEKIRIQMIKEISGLVTLFGDDIQEDSKQQVAIRNERFGEGANCKVLDLTQFIATKDVSHFFITPELTRLISFNGTPEKLLATSYVWSEVKQINLEDLILIHKLLNEWLEEFLHRKKEKTFK